MSGSTLYSQKQAAVVFDQNLLDRVNPDSLARTIKDLINIKTRYILSGGVSQAARYMQKRFQYYTGKVVRDTFQFGPHMFTSFLLESEKILWAGGETGTIVRSTDLGKTWSLQQQHVDDDIKHICFIDGLRGWASGYFGRVFSTRDGGQNWQPIKTFEGYGLGPIAFADPLHGWLGADDLQSHEAHILATQDGGLTWSVQHKIPSVSSVTDIFILNKDSVWAVGSYDWLAFSSNGGAVWTQQTIASDRSRFLKIGFTGSRNGWICGTTENQSGGVVYRTTDKGKTWSNVLSMDKERFYGIDFTDPMHGWLGSFTTDYKGSIFYSRDGGKNWGKKAAFEGPVMDVQAVDSMVCTAVVYDGHMVRTTDGGASWIDVLPAEILQTNENVAAVLKGTSKADSIIVLGAHYDDIAISNPYQDAVGADDNASGSAAVMELARIFSQIQIPYTLEFVAFSSEERSLLGSKHCAAGLKAAGKKIKVMINFDVIGYLPQSASSWDFNLQGSQDQSWIVDLMASMATAYTNLIPNKQYPIEGIGDHFAFYLEGYPAVFVYEHVRNPYMHSRNDNFSNLSIPYITEIVKTGLAAVAGMSGLLSGVDGGCAADVPDSFALLGNYPNSFNTETTIAYEIAESSNIRLAVYAINGVRVLNIDAGSKAPGRHVFTWNAADFPSGVYIIRLRAGRFEQVRKCTLMK